MSLAKPVGGGTTTLPWTNVKDNGVLGDGVDLDDANITSGTNALSSSSATFTAADVGKIIVILDAASGNAYHVTTIVGFTDANNVTLTDNATATATDTQFSYGTDDTSAIQTVIDTVFAAGGGGIFFPIGLYILGGALQTAVSGQASVDLNPNSQLYIPNMIGDPNDPVVANQSNGNVNRNRVPIEFRGEVPPHLLGNAGIVELSSPITGVILRSTIQGSGTRPAVIGGIGGVHGTDNNWSFNPASLLYKNLSIQITPNTSNVTTMGGINTKYLKTANFEYVTVFPILSIWNSGDPTASDVAGIELPYVNCEMPNVCRNTNVGGFTHGYVSGEHSQFNGATVWSCVNGVTFTISHHMNIANKLNAFDCKNVLNFTGGLTHVDIQDLQVEWGSASKWYDATTIIADASNYGQGDIKVDIVEGGVGHNNALYTKTGGQKLKVSPLTVGSIVNTQTGTTYTLTWIDAFRHSTFDNASDITVTIPLDSNVKYSVGDVIEGSQLGVGVVTIVGDGGVTVNTNGSNARTRTQYSNFAITKIDDDIWQLTGDLDGVGGSGNVDGGLFTDVYQNTANVDGGSFV